MLVVGLALAIAAAPLLEEDRRLISAGRAALYEVTNADGFPVGMFAGRDAIDAADPALSSLPPDAAICQLNGERMLHAVRVDIDNDGVDEVVADLGCAPTGGSTAIITQKPGQKPRVAMSFFDEVMLSVTTTKRAVQFVTYQPGYGSLRDRFVRVTTCRSLGVGCRSVRLRFRGTVAGGAATRAIVPVQVIKDERLRQDIVLDDAPFDDGSEEPLPGNVTRTFAKGSTGLVLSEIWSRDEHNKKQVWVLVALPDPGSSDEAAVMLKPTRVTMPARPIDKTFVVGFMPGPSLR